MRLADGTNVTSIFNRFLYPLEFSLKDKIAAICKEIYGADNVEYSELAEKRIEVILPMYLFLLPFYQLFSTF